MLFFWPDEFTNFNNVYFANWNYGMNSQLSNELLIKSFEQIWVGATSIHMANPHLEFYLCVTESRNAWVNNFNHFLNDINNIKNDD